MRSILGLAALTLALSACGSGGEAARPGVTTATARPEPIPFDQIDYRAWFKDARAVGAARVGKDTYRATVALCSESADQLTYGLAMKHAEPAIERVSMEYICPSHVPIMDRILKQNPGRLDELALACALSPEARTKDQQEDVDLAGCR